MALLVVLLALILGGSYAFYRSNNLDFDSRQADIKLTLQLTKAKEALIAYAVIDNKRPGRMPCPDITGNGVSPLLKGDECDGWKTGDPDIYSGWLPWKTLDLLEAGDEQGTPFRYASSRSFGGERIDTPLNSETATSLHVDLPPGTASNDIVAIIIATRSALDTRNSDGDDYFFNGTTTAPEDNDLIAAITRQELMAAVEKRVAGELRHCLEQHAALAADYTYPSPAPLTSPLFQGQAGSRFGMVPATQPGDNPDDLLKQARREFESAQSLADSPLNSANATQKLATLRRLQEAAAYARALYDRLYIVASDLHVKAERLVTAYATLDATLGAVTANSAAFASGASGIPAALDLAQPELDAFRLSLANSGFDLFLMELESENARLHSKIALAAANPAEEMAALQTQVNVFKSKLLANSLTPNPELSAFLASNIELATIAVDAARAAKLAPTDEALQATAITEASSLADANQRLDQAIQAIRLNFAPVVIALLKEQVSAASIRFSANPEVATRNKLAQTLAALRAKAGLLLHGSTAVMAAQAALNVSLETAIQATASGADPALIESSTATVAAQADTLVLAMKANGDNIATATLDSATDWLVRSKQVVPATLTAGRELRSLGKIVSYWAESASLYGKSIAQKARKKVTAEGDSDNAAYVAAQQLLNSLNGSTGAIELMERSLARPADATAQAKAQTALDKTQGLVDALNAKNAELETTLQSALAEAATPTQWLGEACTVFRPPTGSSTWWVSNQWANYVFYQIDEPTRSLPVNQKCVGKLQVNGSGNLCVVTLSAGQPLAGQIRSHRTVAEFFDDPINADNSRNGDASTPSKNFSNKPPSATFNDRLAF